jgi:acyl-CoA dehydrogenase
MIPDPMEPKSVGEDHFSNLLQQAHAIGQETLAVYAAEVDRDAKFPKESIQALRNAKLLSAAVPTEFGGFGLNVIQIGMICEVLGHYCGSTAMIYAMHQIQVACIVHHAQQSEFFRNYLRQLTHEQRLIASATTEVGVGGDLRSSICAVEVTGDSFRLIKKAPVISYGAAADEVLVTCLRAPNVQPNEQVQVLVRREDTRLEQFSGWDTLGFRGTCSCGFVLTATGNVAQIIPIPFADILAQTMHPYSHIVWCSLWSGIAVDAVNKARAFVRAEAKKTPGETPISAMRLAEVDLLLQEMRHNIAALAGEYHNLLTGNDPVAFRSFGFAIRTNNLKLSCSQQVVEIVNRAMLICGLASYRNDSKYSLTRQLRDAYGAALMVNNDRIMKLNATLLLAYKEGHH